MLCIRAGDQSGKPLYSATRLAWAQLVASQLLALFLLYAAVYKAFFPNDTVEAFVALFGMAQVVLHQSVASTMVAILVFAELSVALIVLARPGVVLARVSLVVMYSTFLCIVLSFAIWAPDTACGCGVSGPENAIVEVSRSGLFFLASIFQVLRLGRLGASKVSRL